VIMSNDIKLVAQGALARAASSSAAVNVAHLYADLGRAFRVSCVPTPLSGRGEAVDYFRSTCPRPAAPYVPEFLSLAHEIKSPNCVL
jgi:hypothetical protein